MSDPEQNEVILNEFAGYDDSELRQLIERVAQIEELTQHPGWGFFTDYLIATSVTRQKRIMLGRCETIEEYARETGWIRGVQAAMEAPAKLREKLELHQQLKDDETSPTERNDDGTEAAA